MRPVAILIALLAGPALAQAADVQLGVEVQAITEDLRGHFGAPPGVGLLVEQVTDGGPAAAAGVQAGDVLVELCGHELATPGDLVRAADVEPGSECRLAVIRDRRILRVGVVLTAARAANPWRIELRARDTFLFELPAGETFRFDAPDVGESLDDLAESLRLPTGWRRVDDGTGRHLVVQIPQEDAEVVAPAAEEPPRRATRDLTVEQRLDLIIEQLDELESRLGDVEERL